MPGANSADLWEFNDIDMAKVAEAMGAYGVRVDQPGEIRGALEKALASGRPAVVDVVTDPPIVNLQYLGLPDRVSVENSN